MLDQEEDRARTRADRKDRVLQRAEAEHAHTCFLRRHAEVLERLDVDREPAARAEHPEARGDDRARP